MNYTFRHFINEARNQGFLYQFHDGTHRFIGELPGAEIDIVVDPDEVEIDGIEIAKLKFMTCFYVRMVQLVAGLKSYITQLSSLEKKRREALDVAAMKKGYISPDLRETKFPTSPCYN